MIIKPRTYTGTTSSEPRAYEIKHRKLARKAAAEGMVLLENNGVLPLPNNKAIALYGAGAIYTVKGGTGSGDVNVRDVVSVYDGLKNSGYRITTEEWLESYKTVYEKARLEWRQIIWEKEDAMSSDNVHAIFTAYAETPFNMPVGGAPTKTDTDTAIYVLSRIAGEGIDRRFEKGDYLLSDKEEEFIKTLCGLYPDLIIILNTGGIVDLSFLDRYEQIKAVIYMHQPGMEAGNALADIISGKVVPSGKLTDTWPVDYHDCPAAETFSHNDNDTDKERYTEGIYVGYRYFDTFEKRTRYCFGYGLSYTDFELGDARVTMSRENGGSQINVIVPVKNTGSIYAGREVVQIYCAPPQENKAKEYRRLVCFAKTGLLSPGETEKVVISFSPDALGYFDEEKHVWMIEKGVYGVFIGESLDDSKIKATINVTEDIVLSEVEEICPLREELKELCADKDRVDQRRSLWIRSCSGLPSVSINSNDIKKEAYIYGPSYGDMPDEVEKFVDRLSTEQLILLCTGNVAKGQGATIGSAGITVPGSAAETSDCAEAQGLAPIVLADGPAGLRLKKTYQVENGAIVPTPFDMALEGGFLCRNLPESKGTVYYQYCTAFPVGTLLAQTFDTDILFQVGRAVAEELREFGVTLWLAPGMNIHRDPLCGRNFEYYSEDPLLSGLSAAAITDGVQSIRGFGTTIKHFACNSQEDNRKGSDSILSERALREIYVKGFEIAVKRSHPFAIMTSYNLINGVHAANNYDLCTKLARNEWGYKGLIMTDWTTTLDDPACTASGCIKAGNDIVMPGTEEDHKDIEKALDKGEVDLKDLKRSAARLANIVWQSDNYIR